jgi:hypothetical protein
MQVFNDVTADCVGIITEIPTRQGALARYNQVLARVAPIFDFDPYQWGGKADAIRCIFGNPFRPVTFDPAWRTPDVTALATAAYEERILPSGDLDIHRLAVLADALEEGGASDEVVAHLRSPGPHVRGCWAVDLCLGKN